MVPSAAVSTTRVGWLCLFLLACGNAGDRAEVRDEPAPPPSTESAPPEAPPEPEPEPEVEEPPEPLTMPTDVAMPGEGGFTHDAILADMVEARPTQFKPVGTSSVVFRVQTLGEHMFAFKPPSAVRARAASAEVAAYRLGRLLGYDNVLPAAIRDINRRSIRARLHPRYADEQTWLDLEEAVRWNGLEATGAAIYWVPDMRDIGLDSPEQRREWAGWIGRGGEAPEGQRQLARDLSDLILFDYLIANWDRYSGGNLRVIGSEDAPRVVIRDNDAAFAAPLPDAIETRLRTELEKVERFSRSTIDRLQRLDRETLRAAMRNERVTDETADTAYFLSDAQMTGVLERAATALSYVAALIDLAGEDAVLDFE
ncbi:MAG: hypothetical protein CMN30_30765 [Sandaracinus sp.]|nr:hypothetical protein [Sandaracinus sp.]|tara:strand:- start:1406 stop:2512 length:1107 start_codon:yes stop_codon:yes gene_type:complete